MARFLICKSTYFKYLNSLISIHRSIRTIVCCLLVWQGSIPLCAQTLSAIGGPIEEGQSFNVYSIQVDNLPVQRLSTTYGLKAVHLNITHPYFENLECFLISPNGFKVKLFTNAGGNGKNMINTVLSDSGLINVQENKLCPYTGVFKPQDPLGAMNNYQHGNGLWRLYIRDAAAFDQGSLNDWALEFGGNVAGPSTFESDHPIVFLNTFNDSIKNDINIKARIRIYDVHNGFCSAGDSAFSYEGPIDIAKRGWYSASLPQESYNITLLSSTFDDTSAALLGLPEENDWQLNALYNDKSMIRNSLMYKLFAEMGHYAARVRHCEVFLNGEYLGMYIFSEKIRRTKNRLNISKLTVNDSIGNDLSGGYIFRHDYNINKGWLSDVGPPECPDNKAHFEFEYPSAGNITPSQKVYLRSWVDTLEQRLFSPDINDPLKGYRPLIDIRSFADYFICNELAWNGDGFAKSMYFHKDKDSKDTTLHAGPIWDFDWSLKRMPWVNSDLSGWSHTTYPCTNLQSTLSWHALLTQDSFFTGHLRCRWDSLRTTILDKNYLFHYIDSMQADLDLVQQRHFTRWPIWGINVGSTELPPFAQSYSEELDTLKATLGRRIDWLDNHIPGVCKKPEEPPVNPIDTLQYAEFSVYPNPCSATICVTSNTLNIESVELYSLNGLHIESFKNKKVQNLYSIPVHHLPNGLYLIKLISDEGSRFSKFIVQHE